MSVTLRSGEARARLDPDAGGRLAGLEVAGLSLLVAKGDGELARPTAWGSYPLAPFAGRCREGRFSFEGRQYALPVNWPPHAIHGTTFDRPWRLLDHDERSAHMEIDLGLGDGWPFPGRALQSFALEDGALAWRLEVHASEAPFPASLGWHPWWRRRLARGEEARLAFDARWMYRRDEEGIALAERVRPSARPWDDCFTGVEAPPALAWDGALRLAIESDGDHWVVYDEPRHAICVEPMTGPPDALNIAPEVVTPDRPLGLSVRVVWESD
ncbi:MAG: aldose epimerase [Myxococcota bacterium]